MLIAGFGALPAPGGVRFRVWAPAVSSLSVILHDGPAKGRYLLGMDAEGVYDRTVDGAAAGDRYSYSMDERAPRPDPASRCQPDDVHGPSQIVDPAIFRWTDARWRGRAARDLVIYELHVGTFSPAGTFAGAAECLHHLRDLGVTAIELMPVAASAGDRNWGYDGVCLYAPARAYGTPDDLRALVDRAHHFGLSVVLDVVYNHLGPEGAYLPEFNPQHLTDRHATPWGQAINLDAGGSAMVRRFIVDNARHWVREYHVDGLRLDATHALADDTPRHIVCELADAVREAAGRPILVHAEDHRNFAAMIEDAAEGGWGLDGVWADDFHHAMRRLLAGDSRGYYADYEGTAGELARIVRDGWLYSGQHSPHFNAPRGTDPSRLPMRRFVVCLQNHDQVGNRALGDRLHHAIAPEAWRAASTVLAMVPMTPLLFMGQEWAASSPFLYFTDLDSPLGAKVTEGRRREFADSPEFSSPDGREAIPDPQARSTFEASRLRWNERERPPHDAVRRLTTALLALRLAHAALGASDERRGEAHAPDDDTLVMRRGGEEVFWIVAKLRGRGAIDLSEVGPAIAEPAGSADWEVVLTTEDPLFAPDAAPVQVDRQAGGPTVRFARPGAAILKER
ncbi:MAG: malto-oligosyltrehalose trehalohydrolase [Acidobacteria bacterium RIFCSPLOWO2_02_FULL_67_36]|nr:MAG: malto-oligosyltrehalose trehalohydrolase [Acidobacteria bacterium RIFCSPLOWO2_02_FULL_67_36]OFW19009.1 MAG: malto-oligosyltrehalose trehalohydrolase [Acidobacteria bacterium RIFCSPLOWO2_12_FULL_66_21]